MNIRTSPEKLRQDVIRVRKIRKARIVFVSMARRSLGGKVPVEVLPGLFRSAGVDLAAVVSRALVRI